MFSQLSRSSSYLRAAAPFAPPEPRVARARRAAPVREVLVGRLARDVEAEDAGVRAVVVRGVHLVEALLARGVPDVCARRPAGVRAARGARGGGGARARARASTRMVARGEM